MQDKTINNALLALRKAGGEQGELALRLLSLRGVTPPVNRSRCPTAFRNGQMRRAILEILREGPLESYDVAIRIQAMKPDWTLKETLPRVRCTLSKLKSGGLVRREGLVWRLAP